jgi:hypothetical protein
MLGKILVRAFSILRLVLTQKGLRERLGDLPTKEEVINAIAVIT